MSKAPTKAEFEAIKSSILNLTPTQAREAHILLATLLEGKVEAASPDKFNRMLYDALWRELGRAIGAEKPPLGALYPKISGDLSSATNIVLAYLRKHLVMQPLRDNEFPSFAIELIQVTIESMRERSIPVSCRTVLQQLQTIATTMDEALPGYSEAGFIEPMFLRPAHATV